jgi:exodeoxyribonuclease VII small subunit
MTTKKSYPFEQSLVKLENLVEKMEAGDLTLEDSLKTFEEGIRLTRECQQALSQAEQKVKMLIEENGQLESRDLAALGDD